MPVVIHDFEALPAPDTGAEHGASGAAPPFETAARVAAERALRRLARRQSRLRG